MKNHDEASCLRSLRQKRSISIANRIIYVEKDNTEVGNGSWGKIDYLCNYCGYHYVIVATMPKNVKREQYRIRHSGNFDSDSDTMIDNGKAKFSISKLIKKFKR